jgi:hypothetical protein
MTCEQAKQQFADSLAGQLDAAGRTALDGHLAACPTCRIEMEPARRLWHALDALPEVEPGPALRPRFYQMLEAYEAGQTQKKERRSWFAWWPQQPAIQLALTAAMMVVGIGIGHFGASKTDNREISTLRGEVNTMRQLVTLSLLQQQSASDRLKGVNYSYRVEQSDTEVLSALLRTVNQDDNVNVRLAAVDALRTFGDSPVARRGIVQALGKQNSPLVQAAIVDAITELRDRNAAPALKALLANQQFDPSVKSRLESAVKELQ